MPRGERPLSPDAITIQEKERWRFVAKELFDYTSAIGSILAAERIPANVSVNILEQVKGIRDVALTTAGIPHDWYYNEFINDVEEDSVDSES